MISRRGLLALMGAAGLAGPLQGGVRTTGTATAFSRDWLRAEAQRLSRRAYMPAREVPEGWRTLTYDQYRAIWFNPRRALWADEDRPFQCDFFHPGLYFPRPVEINVIRDGVSQRLAFDLSLFDRTDRFPDLPVDETMGYSGLRLRAELETPGIFTEFAVFQGASYFRAIGTGQSYGLSARGLALNTADAKGEEFPEFTRFWLETPGPGAQHLVMHALLDGPSTTGAYTFAITPGAQCRMSVEATLFPRVALDHVGIAPLTSMFLFDDTNRHRFDDFRSAVHDSDGLMIWNGAGEKLWRPLANPRELQVSSFVDNAPKGFGLVQRTRDAGAFADLEARYENRPSLWITPSGDWGPGAVRLVEIPADKEIYDNIVAYWRPRAPLEAGRPHHFSYDMTWGHPPPETRNVARVVNTRIGKGFDKDVPYRIIAIDFEDHPALRGDTADVTRFISAGTGAVTEGVLQDNPATGGKRLAFKFTPDGDRASELRVQLVRDGRSLTEVWLYRWTP